MTALTRVLDALDAPPSGMCVEALPLGAALVVISLGAYFVSGAGSPTAFVGARRAR